MPCGVPRLGRRLRRAVRTFGGHALVVEDDRDREPRELALRADRVPRHAADFVVRGLGGLRRASRRRRRVERERSRPVAALRRVAPGAGVAAGVAAGGAAAACDGPGSVRRLVRARAGDAAGRRAASRRFRTTSACCARPAFGSQFSSVSSTAFGLRCAATFTRTRPAPTTGSSSVETRVVRSRSICCWRSRSLLSVAASSVCPADCVSDRP